MMKLYKEFFFKIFINTIQYNEVICSQCILYSIDHCTGIEDCLYSQEKKGKTSCGGSTIIWLI